MIKTTPRVKPLDVKDMSDDMQAAYDEQTILYGRMTNMKKTLAHSPVSYYALMAWYELRDACIPFLGERGAVIFSHAISNETDCLVCSTFFRRILLEDKNDPDELVLDAREKTLVEYARQLVKDANAVSDELWDRLKKDLNDEQLVLLTTFGSLMIATNVFNNAIRVRLDDYLLPYEKRE